jgi:hypothetical protein
LLLWHEVGAIWYTQIGRMAHEAAAQTPRLRHFPTYS